ncbi:MAG TPA: PDZ domain-containing protein, partial [Herpetosiphonaceae bacterium]|nr:PDZ domain-containing protein [Herpetosiphonaceae bacterium]
MDSWTTQVGRQWRLLSVIAGVVLVSLGLGAIVLLLRSPVAAAQLQAVKDAGVLVTSVTGDSAADAAGLKRGDIILGIDDQTTDEVAALHQYVLSKRPGDQVRLNVQHGDDLRTLSVTLGEREGQPYMGFVPFIEQPWAHAGAVSGTAGLAPAMGAFHITGMGGATGPLTDVMRMGGPPWLGVEPMTATLGMHFELARPAMPFSDTLFFGGPSELITRAFELHAPPFRRFLIHSVEPGSPAAQAGLVPGDIVTELNGAALESPFALLEAVDAADPGDSLDLTVSGVSGEERSVSVTLGEDPKRAGEAYLGV